MLKLREWAKNSMITLTAVTLVVFSPVLVYAEPVPEAPVPEDTTTSTAPPEPTPNTEEAPTTDVSETTPPSPAPSPPPPAPAPAPAVEQPKIKRPPKPPGADSHAFRFNESTGRWESDCYIWDHAGRQRVAKYPPVYKYNESSNKWEYIHWEWSPPKNKYLPVIKSVATPPPGAKTYKPGQNTSPNTTASSSNSRSGLSATNAPNSTINGLNGGLSDSSIDIGLSTDASIYNFINSWAQSGDASVNGNTTGGSALTGDALAMANVINLLQSSWFPSGELATYVSNIYGDVVGDLFIDPGQLSVGQSSQPDSLTVNSEFNGSIENDITLNAHSGDATVKNNTTGGDATTGSATAVANVVNMMNSAIATGNSFLGILNIHGNLEGDILLPPNLLETLLASNIPRTTISTGELVENEVDAEFTNSHSIVNNVNASATSGEAVVAGNTKAGNATTGNAQTDVTIFNLTGHNVVGKNSLLVFVNVLGEWVGVIMNAPEGSTAAALGGGISEQSILTALAKSVDIDAENNSSIVNNITANAASGDATVKNNTTGGDATSGDATASANVLNISNSNFSLSDWFGVLFINVFGSWKGSFGIDTAFGNPVVDNNNEGSGHTASSGNVQVFRFVPNEDTGGFQLASVTKRRTTTTTSSSAAATAAVVDEEINPAEALGITTGSDNEPPASSAATSQGRDLLFPALGTSFGILLFVAERLLSVRQRRKIEVTA